MFSKNTPFITNTLINKHLTKYYFFNANLYCSLILSHTARSEKETKNIKAVNDNQTLNITVEILYGGSN